MQSPDISLLTHQVLRAVLALRYQSWRVEREP